MGGIEEEDEEEKEWETKDHRALWNGRRRVRGRGRGSRHRINMTARIGMSNDESSGC